MKGLLPLIIIALVVWTIWRSSRRRPAGAVPVETLRETTAVAAPHVAPKRVAQMVERLAASGGDGALAMLEELEREGNAPPELIDALRRATGTTRARQPVVTVATTTTTSKSEAELLAKLAARREAKPQKAAKTPHREAKHRPESQVRYGLRDELAPLEPLAALGAMRKHRPLPPLGALEPLEPRAAVRAWS